MTNRSISRLSSATARTSFYDDVTNKIIAKLEAGRFTGVEPWVAPSAKAPLALPKNTSTPTPRHCSKGTRIPFAGGVDYSDHHWHLDSTRQGPCQHPDMKLLQGGAPRGAEEIAACWADIRKVAQIVFKPDWARHAHAAPFKRSDQLLDAVLIGDAPFPCSGLAGNLADRTNVRGIPLRDFRNRGAAQGASLAIIDDCHRSYGSSAAHALLRVASPILSLDNYLSLQFAALVYATSTSLHDRRHSRFQCARTEALPTFRRKPFTAFHASTQSCAIYPIEFMRASCDQSKTTHFSLERFAPHASDLRSVVQVINALVWGQLLSGWRRNGPPQWAIADQTCSPSNFRRREPRCCRLSD